MRNICVLAAVSGIAFASPDAIARDEPLVLEPSSPWLLDYAEQKCRLARRFGESDDRHMLFLEQGGPSNRFGMTAAGPAFSRFNKRRDVEVTWGDKPPKEADGYYIGDVESYGTAVIFASTSHELREEQDEDRTFDAIQAAPELHAIDTALAAGMDRVIFEQHGREIVYLTGDLSAPFEALNACAFDLVRAWGLDPEKHRTLTRMPKWMNAEKVARRITRAYPSAALRRGEQGFIRMRVIVDENGSVAECHIENATEMDSLHSPACISMRKAEFEPALDSEGRPMRSFYSTVIKYVIG